MTFKPKYFELYEFLPRDFYHKWHPLYGERLWNLFSYEFLWTQDQLRIKYGRMDGNNWYWKDQEHPDGLDPEANQWKGYRPLDCPIGLTNYNWVSAHYSFRAFDPTPIDEDPEVIRFDCLQFPYDPPFKYITAIEKDVLWFHHSFGDHNKSLEGIQVI